MVDLYFAYCSHNHFFLFSALFCIIIIISLHNIFNCDYSKYVFGLPFMLPIKIERLLLTILISNFTIFHEDFLNRGRCPVPPGGSCLHEP